MPRCQRQNTEGYICPLVSHPVSEPFHPVSATNTRNVNKDNLFWCQQGRKQSFYHRAHAFVISLRGICFWVSRLLCHEQSPWWTASAQGQIYRLLCINCSHWSAILVALWKKTVSQETAFEVVTHTYYILREQYQMNKKKCEQLAKLMHKMLPVKSKSTIWG